MAVIHTPVISVSSTAFITSVTLTTAKNSNFATSFACRHSSAKIQCFSLMVRATSLKKYVYPDRIPEFALHETKKFKEELKKKQYKERSTIGDNLDRVLDTCTELFSEFVHIKYGGPGTLLVDLFTDMLN